MQKNIWTKVFAIIIILFFVGLSTTPLLQGLSQNKSTPSVDQLKDDTTFDRKIEMLMTLAHMPSLSACIIKHDTIVWSKGYGNAEIKRERKATNQTIYMAGSISKSFTATAIMQLNETGLIGLDDNVNMYLPFCLYNPWYPTDNITIRMLLGHRSSLNRSQRSFLIDFYLLGYPLSWLSEYLEPNGSIYDPRVWKDVPPGSAYTYANVGFELLGYVIERVTHQSYEQYSQDHILTPLNMTNTSFHFSDYTIDMLAIPYLWIAGRYIPLPNYDVRCTPAGGLRTNAVDLSHFLIAHMNNGTYQGHRILSNASAALMHQVYSDNARGFDYGLGWIIWNDSYGGIYGGHGGNTYGGEALMKYRVSDKVGIIFFANQYIGVQRPFEILSLRCIEKALFNKANQY